MAQNPKYDNDTVNLGYLNKRLGQTEESINKNNSSISQLPKNYSTPPNPPYYKDSLLCYGNKIYKCNTTKLKGEFSWNDWTIVATDDTTISDFINNTYELDKLEIQEQIDGKVQTYYQENDPSKEWTTELDKGRHIGDYWYNTTNNTQWRYNRIINGSTITYGWGQVNIPKAVFDTIDSKKSIYTEKPTSYQKDDLWIIEESLSDEDLPVGTEENPIAKGDWVFSIANSDTYNKEHWVKRDEDISMTYIKQHYYTIGEINSSFEEIERNTDSKITKAKDEISLNVSQTYTTKEEHEATIYDFDEKIGTINQTVTEHKETIADLSIEVGEITSTVETIETTTKNLEIDIDGVSADFENFKDNEYIQSIDNLQKQIDGAIQFWNGAEIPTLENYPTNDWTTENDKINHQADIYTVIQDVEGEMKQGKSYRFDKINGVWQWIELTDNELSAVQSLAQEALNKAKSNATDISTIKTNVSELQQTDKQIKASVSSTENRVNILEETVEIYSIDLDLYNLTIPVNTENKPIETKLYEIGYYAYYKGKQVTPTIISKSTADGIDISTTNGKINLSVNQNNTINNINNELVFEFNYTVDGLANIISKKIIVVLAQQGPQGLQGLQGIQGKQGIQGEKGDTGESGLTSYFHIKYSSVENPTNPNQISETPNVYIGTYVDYTEQDSTDPSKYKWSRFQGLQGETGTQGIPGKNGTDGKTSYLHIKYSNDGGQTFTANSGETVGDYIGQYTDFTLEDSTEVNSYTWSKIKGEQGPQGIQGIQGIQGVKGEDGISTYFHIRYSANANGSSMTTAPQSDTQYMGVASTTSPTAPTSSSGYIWSKIKGEQGEQGIPGQIGESGKTSYLHIKYSEDGTTFTPADSEYKIGEKPSRWQGTYVDFNENDSTKFSDYKWVDTAIVVEDLVTPTNTVSGSNIHIEDASDKKMVNFEIEGKSTQATRSGKNSFNLPNQTLTYNGLTVSVVNNVFNLTGTLTKASTFYFTSNFSLSAGTYTINLYSNSNYPYITLRSNGVFIAGTAYSDKGLLTFTLTEDVIIDDISLYFGSTSVSYLSSYKVQLESGSTATDFEQYGVSPSPDYPSEIESVEYRNLFDKNSANYLSGYILNDSGTKTSDTTGGYTQGFTQIEPNKTYIMSGFSSSKTKRIYFYDENKIFISRTGGYVNLKEVVFTTLERVKYIQVQSGNDETFEKVILTKGTIKHSYIPYGKYGIEVETDGKNKVVPFGFNRTHNGLNFIYNIDGSLKIQGTSTGVAYAISTNQVLKYTKLKAGTYILSGGTTQIPIRFDDKNGKNITSTTGSKEFTLTEETEGFIQVRVGSGVTIDETLYPMIRVSNIEDDTFEPYHKNTSLFVLDQPLRSLPNGVKDIAYIKNNILYVDRYVGSVVLDGNGNFNLLQTLSNTLTFQSDVLENAKLNIANNNASRCDYFKLKVNYSLDEEHYYYTNAGRICLFINKTRLSSQNVAGFKSWLSTHNTQVDYELAEPYTEKVGEVEIPSTFKGINNITITDELEPVMNIEYVRDTILSDYVEGQVSNAVAIQERKNAEFQITNEEIKSTVSAISIDLDGTKSSLNSVEEKITSQEKTIKIISRNIDSTTGNITEVTTTNGFTFNSNGLKIYIDENSYNTVIDNVGTYYKDGDEVINQTTKDGSILTNLSEKGQTKYSYNENDDYDFIEERIESDGEYAYATFYNGEE